MDLDKVQDAIMRKMAKRDCFLIWKQYLKSRLINIELIIVHDQRQVKQSNIKSIGRDIQTKTLISQKYFQQSINEIKSFHLKKVTISKHNPFKDAKIIRMISVDNSRG